MDPAFRKYFDQLPGLFLILDPRLTILGATDAYLSATMTTRENIVGRHIFDVFPDNPDNPDADGVANLRRSLELVLSERRPNAMAVQKYDVVQPEELGGRFEERFWSPLNVPLLDADGAVRYICHSVKDVTDIVRPHGRAPRGGARDARTRHLEAEIVHRAQEIQAANQRLVEANAALQASQREAETLAAKLEAAVADLQAFTYSISHDLRAPLRNIVAVSEILLNECRERLDPEHVFLIERQSSNAVRLADMIDGLLAISRVDHGELVREHVDMSSLAHQIARQFADQQRAFCVTFEIEPNLSCEGDRQQVSQLLTNLLENAAKFSPHGGSVHFRQFDCNGAPAWSIRDDGIGFDMAYAKCLFKPFERLVRQEEFPGTGIGLATVKHIIDRHGGRVWVHSAPGKGSEFFFTLSGG